MWRNHEILALVEWLRDWNAAHAPVGFYGLDLYSLHRSIRLVLDYLDRVDPVAAGVARERYGSLMPWEGDPATCGRAVVTGRYRACEGEVVAMLRDMLAREIDYAARDGEHFLDAVGNARVVANAEGVLSRDVLRGECLLEPSRPAHVRDARGAAPLPSAGTPLEPRGRD